MNNIILEEQEINDNTILEQINYLHNIAEEIPYDDPNHIGFIVFNELHNKIKQDMSKYYDNITENNIENTLDQFNIQLDLLDIEIDILMKDINIDINTINSNKLDINNMTLQELNDYLIDIQKQIDILLN
jgi:hypothetical protein